MWCFKNPPCCLSLFLSLSISVIVCADESFILDTFLNCLPPHLLRQDVRVWRRMASIGTSEYLLPS